MEFAYTPEQVDLQQRAAAFTARLMEHEEAVESSGGDLDPAIQAELVAGAIEAGLWAMNMPVEWGGLGLGVVEDCLVVPHRGPDQLAAPFLVGGCGAQLGDGGDDLAGDVAAGDDAVAAAFLDELPGALHDDVGQGRLD